MKSNSMKKIIYMSGLALLSTQVLAHTTIVKKNTPDNFSVRTEIEGSSSVINAFSIPHGCAAPDSREFKSVRAQGIMFPNGADSIAIQAGTGAVVNLQDEIVGNAIMSATPIQDFNIFKKIKVVKGPVPEFNSHGVKTQDNRAFHYSKGRLATDLVGLVPFRASFPTFKPESCAVTLNIKLAVANYCTRSKVKDNRADIWIGNTTEKFNDPDVVSTGFWPYIDVARNLNTNPLPESCGEGYVIEVYPGNEAIDKYLPVRGYWPALFK